jgi:hypothetical protein
VGSAAHYIHLVAELRVSDQERDAVAREIREHFAAGG